MRVALIVRRFPVLSETFIVSKFQGLNERGLDVHIICSQIDRDAWETFPYLRDNPRVRRRVHCAGIGPKRLFAISRMLGNVVSLLLRRPLIATRYVARGWKTRGIEAFRELCLDSPILRLAPDIVHFEFGTIAVERAYLKARLGCSVSVSFRGYDLNFAGLDQPDYYGKLWPRVSAVHCLGEDLWKRALRRGCPPDLPHALIPPAFDPRRYPGRLRTPDDKIEPLMLLSIGRLHWKKGYEYALSAVSILRDRGFALRYRIVGGGSFLEAVAYCRHQLGLESVVDLVGPAPPAAAIEEMLQADIFVHSAVSEGFSNAVQEAQAMGLPVVCSDADGLPENVLHGETGLIVPRRDSLALANGIGELALDPTRRAQMGAQGRRRVLEQFTLDRQIDEFEKFFVSIQGS